MSNISNFRYFVMHNDTYFLNENFERTCKFACWLESHSETETAKKFEAILVGEFSANADTLRSKLYDDNSALEVIFFNIADYENYKKFCKDAELSENLMKWEVKHA